MTVIAIGSVEFPGVFLRMDGTGITDSSGSGAGTVNCQFGVGTFEKFRLEPQGDGTVAIASVRFPGVFLRLDGAGVTSPSGSGGGVVNCQFGVGDFEKFRIGRGKDGAVTIGSAHFPGVFLRMDGGGVTAFSAAGAGIVNAQFGAGAFEAFSQLELPLSQTQGGADGPLEASEPRDRPDLDPQGNIEGPGDGEGTGDGCFAGDVPIATDDGPKSIRSIDVGQVVRTFDDLHRILAPGVVKRVFHRPHEPMLEITVDGVPAPVRVTPRHRFRVDDGWVPAKDLCAGMGLLRLVDGALTSCRVIGVRSAGYAEVFNLQVEPTHTFFADGILVHNVKVKEDPKQDPASAPVKI